MSSAKVRPVTNFLDLLASADLTYLRLAKSSGVGESTIRAIIHPHHHNHRRGMLFRRTAWKLARGYAHATNMTEEQAFNLLF